MLQRWPSYVVSMPAQDPVAAVAQRKLPPGYDVDKHFGPRYDPWDQRLCVAPDGDLFAAIRDGRASVVTDQIDSLSREIALSQTLGYKGTMLSDVPNLALVFGYTNASWTLKSDLTCRYVCRLLRHMDRHGYASCTPRNRDHTLASEPFINLSSSSSFQRSVQQFPHQGARRPWRPYQNYLLDILALRLGAIEDGALELA
jgi:monooxygenase